MAIEQTVEVPPNRQLFVEVPKEIPVGKTILTFTPVSERNQLEHAKKVWAYNRTHPKEMIAVLQKLQGCLGKNAFAGLDGVAYQRKVRDEWDD